jgi:hypothetical protein
MPPASVKPQTARRRCQRRPTRADQRSNCPAIHAARSPIPRPVDPISETSWVGGQMYSGHPRTLHFATQVGEYAVAVSGR